MEDKLTPYEIAVLEKIVKKNQEDSATHAEIKLMDEILHKLERLFEEVSTKDKTSSLANKGAKTARSPIAAKNNATRSAALHGSHSQAVQKAR